MDVARLASGHVHQGIDDVAEREQRLVDLVRLLETQAGGVRVLLALRASEVHQVEAGLFGPPQVAVRGLRHLRGAPQQTESTDPGMSGRGRAACCTGIEHRDQKRTVDSM